MPKPERRIGTTDIVSGATVVVSYSKPRGVLSYVVTTHIPGISTPLSGSL